jgi:DNA-binding NtrC family response regulator
MTTPRELPVLVVDDERMALARCELALRGAGVAEITLCQDPRAAGALLDARPHAMAFVDLDMPHRSGESLLTDWVQQHPDMPVIILTGANDVETAVRCMQQGAFDYVLKPIEDSRVAAAVRRALEVRELRDELSTIKRSLLADDVEEPGAFAPIVTGNPRLRALFRYVEAVATTDRPVLITGETGVGKELMARAIHQRSGRRGPFVAVNISGLDDSLFSDMLFGHLRGAFTGADTARAGLIEQAAGGTLFLDEIGDLSTVSQIKILRLIQEREYFPLGANTPKRTDARVVVATLRDLEAAQQTGEFRRDLYYRLQTHRVHIPPLRERRDDLPLLLRHFLAAAARDLGIREPAPPPGLLDLLAAYPFPGNIRELESMVFDAVSSTRGKTLPVDLFKAHIARNQDLPPLPGGPVAPAGPPAANGGAAALYRTLPQLPTLKQATQALVDEALLRANQNQSVAAGLLGVAPSSLNKRLKRARERGEGNGA